MNSIFIIIGPESRIHNNTLTSTNKPNSFYQSKVHKDKLEWNGQYYPHTIKSIHNCKGSW